MGHSARRGRSNPSLTCVSRHEAGAMLRICGVAVRGLLARRMPDRGCPLQRIVNRARLIGPRWGLGGGGRSCPMIPPIGAGGEAASAFGRREAMTEFVFWRTSSLRPGEAKILILLSNFRFWSGNA
jgi:hypothetical protein